MSIYNWQCWCGRNYVKKGHAERHMMKLGAPHFIFAVERIQWGTLADVPVYSYEIPGTVVRA